MSLYNGISSNKKLNLLLKKLSDLISALKEGELSKDSIWTELQFRKIDEVQRSIEEARKQALEEQIDCLMHHPNDPPTD